MRHLLCFTLLILSFHILSGQVKSYVEINSVTPGFDALDENTILFGSGIASIGDLDGDGISELAVGINKKNDGGPMRGGVIILFITKSGSIKKYTKISSTSGNFNGSIQDNSQFGVDVEAIGDLDKDGVPDIAVSNYRDNDTSNEGGAIWILFLNSNGTVKSHQKISSLEGNFTQADASARFGTSIANIGDLNKDGIIDLAVGAIYTSDLNYHSGAVHILFMNSDGTVKNSTKISNTSGDFTGNIPSEAFFGYSVAKLDDLNKDGVVDLAVGAHYHPDGGVKNGAVYILFLKANGTVLKHQKISALDGDLDFTLNNSAFGRAMDSPGDMDGDGNADLMVGGFFDSENGYNSGATWLLFLGQNGKIAKCSMKFNNASNGMKNILENNTYFGSGVAYLGDLDGDTIGDWAIGAQGNSKGGSQKGAIYIVYSSPLSATSNSPLTDTSICSGDSIAISLPTLNNINWTPAYNISCQACSNPVFYPDTSTEYKLSYTICNLEIKDSIRINVEENQVAIAGGDIEFCAGDSVSLGQNSLLNNYTYQWTPTNFLSNNNRPVTKAFPPYRIEYTLSITSPSGCLSNDTVIVYPEIPPEINLFTDTNICLEDTLHINIVQPNNVKSVTWFPQIFISNPYSLKSDFYPKSNTTYTLEFTSNNNCMYKKPLEIKVLESIQNPDFEINQHQCFNSFLLQHIYGLSAIWEIEGENIQNNYMVKQFYTLGTREITLRVNPNFTCETVVSKTIEINLSDISTVHIPNAFSPNGDGINDLLTIVNDEFNCQDFTIEIYDRWGREVNIIHESFWDGKNHEGEQVPVGIYMYMISSPYYKDSGIVHLIR